MADASTGRSKESSDTLTSLPRDDSDYNTLTTTEETCGLADVCDRKLPYCICVILGIALFLGVVGFSVYLCAQSISGFVHRIHVYENEALRIYNVTHDWLDKHHIDVDVDLHSWWHSVAQQMAESVALALAQFLGSLALVVIFAMYMLCGKHEFPEGSVRKQVDSHMQQYIFFKTLVSGMVGCLVAICFLVMGADLAFFWGFVTFFANWIPNIGAMIATLFPLPFIALDPAQDFFGCGRFAAVIFALAGPLPAIGVTAL